MTISASLREQIRQRAGFVCEYCGVSETQAGGELTIDHYHPQAQGGTDDDANLLYCCPRCNSYKASYWPLDDEAPHLWHPRQETFAQHFLLLDGRLYSRTTTGVFTIRRLHLNRAPLIAHRLERQRQSELGLLLEQYRADAGFWEHIAEQRKQALNLQDALLERYSRLLDDILGDE